MPDRPRRPRLIPLAWALAGAALLALGVSVWRYLDTHHGDAHHGDTVGGMVMGGQQPAPVSAGLYRAGAGAVRPLLGSALVTRWQLDAVAVAVLVLAAAWYLTCVALVPIRAPGSRWPRVRTAAFLAGLGVCAVATNGSIAVYDQVLFTAHMVGHLALVMLAPALLMAGRPLALRVAAAPPARREPILRRAQGRVASLLTAPPVALAGYAAVIVGSHLTGLMDQIMKTTWAGQLEHLVYVLVGCQFFILIVGDEPIRWRLSSPARWLLLLIAMAVDTFTGVILMQGTRAIAMLPAPDLAVNALSDTRTGGAIMWFGGDGIMAAVMIVLVIGWLRAPEPRSAEEAGWLEQARRATFAAHTGGEDGGTGASGHGFDDDDQARAAYNAWLEQLQRRP